MTVQVSVVVPTYRRTALLRRCLEALTSQDFDPEMVEILVVDDGADEETRQVVEQFARKTALQLSAYSMEMVEMAGSGTFGEHQSIQADWHTGPDIRYLPALDTSGPAAARNIGWRAALGEIIAFTDDDTIPMPDWLKQGVLALNGEVMGASGRLLMPLPDQPTDYELNASYLTNSTFVTANCFYRRCALEEVGGFDERFGAAWREDTDLYFRMLKAGFRLVQAPAAVVVHPIRPAQWGVSLKQQRKSLYNVLLYKNHPQLYRQYVQSAPPWRYLSIVLSALLAILMLVLGNWLLAAVFALFWAVQTLIFCVQRLRNTSHRMSHVLEMLVTSILIPPMSIYWRLYGAIKFHTLYL